MISIPRTANIRAWLKVCIYPNEDFVLLVGEFGGILLLNGEVTPPIFGFFGAAGVAMILVLSFHLTGPATSSIRLVMTLENAPPELRSLRNITERPHCRQKIGILRIRIPHFGILNIRIPIFGIQHEKRIGIFGSGYIGSGYHVDSDPEDPKDE